MHSCRKPWCMTLCGPSFALCSFLAGVLPTMFCECRSCRSCSNKVKLKWNPQTWNQTCLENERDMLDPVGQYTRNMSEWLSIARWILVRWSIDFGPMLGWCYQNKSYCFLVEATCIFTIFSVLLTSLSEPSLSSAYCSTHGSLCEMNANYQNL